MFRLHEADAKCVGFHPDYAVEWSVAGRPYHCLICFGCGEVMIQGPADRTRHDLTREASRKLRDVLAPHRKNRPSHAFLGPMTPT